MSDLEASLARLSGDEIVSALRLGGAPRSLQAAARSLFSAVSTPLGRALARFDADIQADGASRAAAAILSRLGARMAVVGPRPPPRGAVLVVSNHPGAYDALSLLAAVERDDVAILAADRAFLRAMPSLADHLVFVPDPPAPLLDRTRAIRRALAHLAAGGALLHFGAGQIEPDPAFASPAPPLAAWAAGTGALVRGAAAAGGSVSAAIVEGVHSRRAKRLPLTRLAERHGVTTLAPLLQVSLRAFRDVDVTVRFAEGTPARDFVGAGGGGGDAAITARVRDRAASLLAPPRRR